MIKLPILFSALVCSLLILSFTETRAGIAGISIQSKSTQATLEQVVGDEVSFTIQAQDKNGNLIRGWNNSGSDVTLTVTGSGANTDSEPLTVTEIKDINGNLLAKQGSNAFVLPKSLFINGETRIFFRTTKADSGIVITTSPAIAQVKNISATMNYRADVVQNFLVVLKQAKDPNIVYVMRRYEIQVTPRDRYNNINAVETVVAKFTARHPGEFINTAPGTANIFSGEHFIQGSGINYFVTSTQIRTDQSITVYKSSDELNVRGTTGDYVIAAHPPDAFTLLLPADNAEIFIDRAAQIQDMTWQVAADPYTNIVVGGQTYSDEVTYMWNATSLTGAPLLRLGSNNNTRAAKLTLTGSQMTDVITKTTGLPTSAQTVILWSVEATDGLFTTRSTQEWKLTLTKRGITDVTPAVPSKLGLSQNYPNPFNPSTSISFEIPQYGFVNLKVFDLLGNEVTTLVNKNLDAGSHSVVFNASEIPSGLYLYKLKFGSQTLTRKMALVK